MFGYCYRKNKCINSIRTERACLVDISRKSACMFLLKSTRLFNQRLYFNAFEKKLKRIVTVMIVFYALKNG